MQPPGSRLRFATRGREPALDDSSARQIETAGELADRIRPSDAIAPDARIPGSVRANVVAQHRAIDEILLRVEEVLRQSDLGEPITSFVMPKLTRLASELSSELRAHLAYENHHLLPLVRAVGLWDQERVLRTEREHAEQRDRLDRLMQEICTLSTPDARIVRALREFVEHLRVDMQQEEVGILAPEVTAGAVAGGMGTVFGPPVGRTRGSGNPFRPPCAGAEPWSSENDH